MRNGSIRYRAKMVCCAAALTVLASGCALAQRDRGLSAELVSSRQCSQQALCAIDRNDWATAEALLKQATEVCAEDAEARRLYAEALWRRGAQQEALRHIEIAEALATNDIAVLLRGAEMRVAMGDTARALQSVERAIDLDPFSATAWTIRASVVATTGDWRQAVADYHRALSLDPGNREIMYRLADAYRQLGEPQRALANLQSLLDTYPPGEEPQNVLMLVGMTYSAMQRHDAAIEHLIAARDAGAPNAEVLYRLGEAQLAAQRTDDARRTLDALAAMAPGHPGLNALMARVNPPSPERTAHR